MNQGKLVFSQLMAFVPLSTFRRCVANSVENLWTTTLPNRVAISVFQKSNLV